MRRRLDVLLSDIVDRERFRIGAELHDGLGQELAGLALMLQGIAKRAQKECPSLASEICRLSRMASASVGLVHDAARAMLPLEPRCDDFKHALQTLARTSRRSLSVRICLRFCGEKTDHPKGQVAEHFYRIAQEAITNAVRHGRAKQISIAINTRGSEVSLTVCDNGVGFERGHSTQGIGLRIMRYRARILGGLLEVKPMRSHGTRVICVVPRDCNLDRVK